MADPLKLPKPFGFNPLIRSRTDVCDALECLVWMAAVAKTAADESKAAKLAADVAAAEALELKVGSKLTTIPEFAAILKEAVRQYLLEHPDELEGKSRMMTVPQGAVGLAKNPDKLQIPEERQDELTKSVVALVAAPAERMLKRLDLFPFWKVKVEPNIAGVKAEISAGKITKEEAAAQGFVWIDGEDRVEFKGAK